MLEYALSRLGMHRRKSPEFGLTDIRICNVGTIEDLTIDLTSSSLLSLYAGNGIGKTTILECISLVGHIPCFPSIGLGGEVSPSVLVRKFGKIGETSSDHFQNEGILDFKSMTRLGITSWIEKHRPGRNAPYGLVEIGLFDVVGTSKGSATHRIYIFINSFDVKGRGFPKLTKMLSRGEFDTSSKSGRFFCDDRTLGEGALVVYDGNEQKGQTFSELEQKLTKGRTYFIFDNVDEGSLGDIRVVDPGAAVEPRSVAYINTDLNDFGRGNDLRESPKDLRKDFGREMRDRLRMEMDEAGNFKYFKELAEICQKILITPQAHYSDAKVIPQSFVLASLRFTEDQFDIVVSRGDGSPPVPVSFLSAGENEVFFVLLMMLNLCRNPAVGKSIILLDEPDLHISNSSRNAFFERILALTDGRSQLIVSTHSPALYELLSRTVIGKKEAVKVLFKVVLQEEPLKVMTVARYDGVYLGKLSLLGYRSNFFRMWLVRYELFVAVTLARLEMSIKTDNYASIYAVIGWSFAVMACLFFVIGASLNDLLNKEDASPWVRQLMFMGYAPAEYHDKTRPYFFGFLGGAVLPALVVWIRIKSVRSKQAQLLQKLFMGKTHK